ncbi:unnamed protein product, partial [Vitis vinifera]|uniref:Uncharacterized protein n=1 Tax=Vitis vinifera TaxID=29760 RepID=D7U0M2_VITVI
MFNSCFGQWDCKHISESSFTCISEQACHFRTVNGPVRLVVFCISWSNRVPGWTFIAPLFAYQFRNSNLSCAFHIESP